MMLSVVYALERTSASLIFLLAVLGFSRPRTSYLERIEILGDTTVFYSSWHQLFGAELKRLTRHLSILPELLSLFQLVGFLLVVRLLLTLESYTMLVIGCVTLI
jgi:hypothetical protein